MTIAQLAAKVAEDAPGPYRMALRKLLVEHCLEDSPILVKNPKAVVILMSTSLGGRLHVFRPLPASSQRKTTIVELPGRIGCPNCYLEPDEDD
jgi:hypothetical protein